MGTAACGSAKPTFTRRPRGDKPLQGIAELFRRYRNVSPKMPPSVNGAQSSTVLDVKSVAYTPNGVNQGLVLVDLGTGARAVTGGPRVRIERSTVRVSIHGVQHHANECFFYAQAWVVKRRNVNPTVEP